MTGTEQSDFAGLKTVSGLIIRMGRSWLHSQEAFCDQLLRVPLEHFKGAVDELLNQVGDPEKDRDLRLLLGGLVSDVVRSRGICPFCMNAEIEMVNPDAPIEILRCKGCNHEIIPSLAGFASGS